jgi:UDP-galactopyranose mutase
MRENPILVVGAGFSGAIIARELADAALSVVIIDRRNHVAGNAYDYLNEFGIRVHKYGPHIFHTSKMEVVRWLSRFTDWIPYQHRVKGMLHDGALVTLPVNRRTAATVGQDNIVSTFIRPYSEKMWGLPLEELDPGILSRVPVRDDDNDLYFPNDSFQAMPSAGYTELVRKMLDHPFIDVRLNTEFSRGMDEGFSHIFCSMPIDEYFGYQFGDLPYRSIKFHHVDLPIPRIFSVPVINFTHDLPFTRITEWKNFPGNPIAGYTSLTYEEPCSYLENNMERYYPVKDLRGQNRTLFQRYQSLVKPNMTFIGRCGLYAYLDMHQAVSVAMSIAKRYLASIKGFDLPGVSQTDWSER